MINPKEIKKAVTDYFELQSRLQPSQKMLKELSNLLSNSRRYVDYCTELEVLMKNDLEVILLAEHFFFDCYFVFQDQSILKLAILLDKSMKSFSIEKFFKVLIREDINKFNNYISDDRKELNNVRNDFSDFKDKRDKEIAHLDKKNSNRDHILRLDTNSLINLQSRIYQLIEKYFELLDLPKPSSLMDNSSSVFLVGLDTLKSVLIRGLTELDFKDNENIQKIIESANFVREVNKQSS